MVPHEAPIKLIVIVSPSAVTILLFGSTTPTPVISVNATPAPLKKNGIGIASSDCPTGQINPYKLRQVALPEKVIV